LGWSEWLLRDQHWPQEVKEMGLGGPSEKSPEQRNACVNVLSEERTWLCRRNWKMNMYLKRFENRDLGQESFFPGAWRLAEDFHSKSCWPQKAYSKEPLRVTFSASLTIFFNLLQLYWIRHKFQC
jgi:hypothetical protein